MRSIGAVHEAMKGQVTKDLIKDCIENLDHKYRIIDVEQGITLNVDVKGILDVDNLINGKRCKSYYKNMDLFESLREKGINSLVVMDMNEPVSCRRCNGYTYNPRYNKYMITRMYELDANGNIDYEETRNKEAEVDSLLVLCGLA